MYSASLQFVKSNQSSPWTYLSMMKYSIDSNLEIKTNLFLKNNKHFNFDLFWVDFEMNNSYYLMAISILFDFDHLDW